MKAVLSIALLVGLFGIAWSGVVTYDSGYYVQPQVHHTVYSSGEILHTAGDTSGGYSSIGSSAPGGYSSSISGVDSFADPKNRGPEVPGPKPKYGAPVVAVSNAYDTDTSAKKTEEAEAPISIDDEEAEVDFTPPPRKSLFSRIFGFLTKQFSNIMAFLRRIWGRLRGKN